MKHIVHHLQRSNQCSSTASTVCGMSCCFCCTQAKKAAEAAAKPPSKKAALLDDSTDEADPTLYFENRVKHIAAKKAKGINPYPHKFHVSTTLPEYIKQYSSLEPGARLDDVTVSLAGGNQQTQRTGGSRAAANHSTGAAPASVQQVHITLVPSAAERSM